MNDLIGLLAYFAVVLGIYVIAFYGVWLLVKEWDKDDE